jgi:starch-binding outer membrane protein, SusD/RagB family
MKLLNKNKCITLFTFIVILSATVSCKKYLEVKPDSKLSVPTTIADLQGILDFTNDMNLQSTPGFGTSSSDESYLLESAYNSFTKEAQKIYTWNRGDYYYQNSWAKAYLPVFNANFCLEQIEKIPITDKLKLQWENIKGSALFYRSYYFLGLLWDFSKAYDSTSYNTDLGIVLRLGSNFNVPSTRASVKECYDRVIEDAKLSATYLPEYPFHVMRPSKGAAYGLLARAYLSMRAYDSAFKYAGLCLQINNNLIDYNSDPDINGNIGADVPFKRFTKETIFYTEMNQNDLLNTPSRAKIDTLLYSMYNNNDLRKTAFFKSSSGYRFKSIYTGNISQYFSGIATDEIYLIKAECGARIGKISEAMNDLNTLMKKRWKNTVPFPVVTATDATDAIQKILTERRKELLMRGVRWIDIKRLNKGNANIVLVRKMGGLTYTLAPNANYYALPIPADIIQASGIPQNEK